MASRIDTEALVAEYRDFYVYEYMVTSAGALLVYHYALTFSDEITQWRRPKLSGAFILYISNRYLILADYIFSMPFWKLSNNPTMYSNLECEGEALALRILSAAAYVPWAAFSGLRAWALKRDCPWLALIVFVLSLSPLVVNTTATHWDTGPVIDPLWTPGCYMGQDVPPSLYVLMARPVQPMAHSTRSAVAVLGRLPLIVADLIVIFITWTTQYKHIRDGRTLGKRKTIMSVLLWNGTLYFLVITILDVLQMALSIQSRFTVSNTDSTASSLSAFINPLTAMLVSNFLVNLRNAADSSAHPESLSSLGTLEFKVIGELGSTISGPGETETWGDEDSEDPTCSNDTELPMRRMQGKEADP
ncbi:hypothetical protein OH77DRAFT_1524613 [Trametes cingulata]|nr:hypothetical protein OH77DRAFT_1524613 [Trametes cingulata]